MHDVTCIDTRKTAPGMRLIDKLSVRIGGGMNHRIGLYDMVRPSAVLPYHLIRRHFTSF